MGYFNSDAKKVFTELRQAFTQVPIVQNFESEQSIWIEINTSGYTIGVILSGLIPDG